MKRIPLAVIASLAIVSALIAGCGDKAQPKSYALVIECDDEVAKGSVVVDLIPVSELDRSDFERCSVSEYWKPGNSLRAGADKITIKLGAGRTNRYVLKTSDPELKGRWKVWMAKQVTHLVVIADLPTETLAAGDFDPRRKTIPLDKEKWPGAKALRVYVQGSRVSVEPLSKVPK